MGKGRCGSDYQNNWIFCLFFILIYPDHDDPTNFETYYPYTVSDPKHAKKTIDFVLLIMVLILTPLCDIKEPKNLPDFLLVPFLYELFLLLMRLITFLRVFSSSLKHPILHSYRILKNYDYRYLIKRFRGIYLLIIDNPPPPKKNHIWKEYENSEFLTIEFFSVTLNWHDFA